MATNVQIDPKDYLILVCDDEEAIRGLLGEAIAGWGFQVATAPSGEAGLAYIQAGNIPHIVVTDIRMPGMSGMDLSAHIKKMSSEIEVIIMTSHGTFETAVQAMRLGVYDYLSKPFDSIDDVRAVLEHVCERIYLRYYTEYLMQELQHKNQEVESLAQMATELSQTLEIAKTIEVGCRGLSRGFGGGPAVFFQYNPVQKTLVATARWPEDVFARTLPQLGVPAESAADVPKISAWLENLSTDQAFQALIQQADQLTPEEARGPSPDQPWRIISLVTRGLPRGAFVVKPTEWKEAESPAVLERYRQTIATSFETAVLHARVIETAIRDGMTGLFNVRHFKERFNTEIQRGLRLRHPLSLLFFDVDHFKKYNDTHGHPAGDEVLRRVADLMRKNFRTTDILARYGGEEFVVLMPDTAFVDALEKAERFRVALEEYPFENEHTQPLGKVTVSIGVSEYPSIGSSVETVIKAADDALYEAKKKSRNVVVPGKAPEGYVPAYPSESIRTQTAVDRQGLSSRIVSPEELEELARKKAGG